MIRKIWNSIMKVKGLKSVTTISLATIIGNGISALFWIYLADLLGAEQYGQISYLIAIASTASTITLFGGQFSITVYTAKKVNIHPPIYLISILSSAIAAIVLYFVFLNIGISVYVLGYVIYNLTISELLGWKLYHTWSKYFIIQKILMVLLSIAFYYVMGLDGVLLGLGLSFAPFINQIIKTLKKESLDFSILKSRLGFIVNNHLMDFTGVFRTQIDKLIIAPMFGFFLLGNYFLVLQIFTFLAIVPTSIFKYTLPEDASGTRTTQLKIITIIISIILAFIGAIIVPLLIPIFFEEYTESVNLIKIMSFNLIASTIGSMLISDFLGKEKSKYPLTSNIIFIIIFVSGIYILGNLYSITGLAISYILAGYSSTIFLAIIYFRRKNNFKN